MRRAKQTTRLLLPVLALASLLCVAADGAVIGTDGLVATRVQEQQNGEPGSVTADQQSLADGAQFPLSVSAALDSTDLEGTVVSLAESLSRLDDPARLDDPNPQEFGIEAACYSDAESISYVVTSEAEEARTVLFTTAGNPAAPPEIDFGLRSTADIESRVFLSGAAVAWSGDPASSLDDLLATLTVQITGSGSASPLFRADVIIAGSGGAIGEPMTTGPIVVRQLGLTDLAGLGLDDASLSALQPAIDSGGLAIVVIPQQDHAYEYTVTANEPLELVARLEAAVQNVPAGTGVAATWGRPFTNLANFVERGLPGVDGQALQQAINKAIEAGVSKEPPDGPIRNAVARMCGAFGFAPLALLVCAWPMLRAGRTTSRRS